MTKIISVPCENDYEALAFENKYGSNPGIEVWEEIKANGFFINDGYLDEPFEVNAQALEFGEVDKEFIKFSKSFIDYDDSKHFNYFLVKQ